MKNKRRRWKNGVILIPVLCVLLLTGCGLFQEEKIKLRDLDFTVLSDEKIPEELKTMIRISISVSGMGSRRPVGTVLLWMNCI